jgi:pSer/pThr/pTyr-binding forkhead associated (FHA) protein
MVTQAQHKTSYDTASVSLDERAMKEPAKTYKYSCRTCPIRQRCIDSKNLSPGLKMTLEQRFKNRTDTFETWDVLQQDCLLLREERRKADPQATQTGLLRRLNLAKQATTNELSPTKLKPAATWAKRKPVTSPSPALSPVGLVPQQDAHGITVIATERMIRLPGKGEVVLGRFEHGFANPPDVDLSFDDGEFPSVSRRHALVMGKNGKHWLEDMGSTNGTYINGRQLSLGTNAELNPGDRILLGRCRLMYVPFPQWAVEANPYTHHTCTLFITHTGDQIELPLQREIMLGRSDPTLDYVPDLDLNVAGDISLHVSRRHVRIIERNGRHYLEEMGSASGTRVNGLPVHMGDAPLLLYPGDQLWLGGCVVAYEWQLL